MSTAFAVDPALQMVDQFATQALRVALSAGSSLWTALQLLLFSAVWFGGLALLLKGTKAIAAARRAAGELRLNLSILVADTIFVAPFVALLVKLVRLGIEQLPFGVLDGRMWDLAGRGATLVAVVFIGDFMSYWRHRLEHTKLLWPAHAMHHSDTEMTWLTLARFHPIDRVVTAIGDIAILAFLGFPDWALVANQIVRHYYGEFIHADLPWTYGFLGRVFVSPVMHRWHHARDVVGAGSNFATVLSVFDQAFGTYHVPGSCTVPLGVTDDVGSGLISQLRFPFLAWTRAYRAAPFTDTSPSQDLRL